MKLKLLDLFSGIGGFSLGLESTGYFKTIAFVEKDKFCQQVLQKNFKDTPIESEVRNVKGDKYAADIITGGFPCQPFSVAGKRRGTDDDRYLWDETIRVVAECKPRWFIGENVEGIVNIQDGMVLRQVQDDLEKEGFQVQCLVIPASGIGAWHQRKRVWIIAHSNSNRESRRSQYVQERSRELGESHVSNTYNSRDRASRHGSQREREKNGKKGQNRSQFESSRHSKNDVSNSHGNEYKHSTSRQSRANEVWGFYSKKEKQTTHDIRSEATRCDVVSGEQEDVSNSNSLRISAKTRNLSQADGKIQKDGQSNRRNTKSISRSFERGDRKKENVSNSISKGLENDVIQSDNKQTTKTKINSDRSFERQQTWWQTQSELCGVPNGVSYELDKGRTNRIKALGNSIVPQIAEQIFRSIIDAE